MQPLLDTGVMPAEMPNDPSEHSEKRAPAKGCEGGCGACQAFARLEADMNMSPAQFLLGAMWVFALPAVGLIVGTALAAQWDGHALLQILVIVGSLAGSVVVSVIGRKATLCVRPSCLRAEGNVKK